MDKIQKVIVLGLENAGKTSLLSTFGGNLGINKLASLEPTRGVKRNKIKTDEIEFFIWDFGGQADHREEYLEDPEGYFLGVDLLIYVVDVQAINRFDESLEFFSRIVMLLKELNENPYVLIFIHKVDPEIKKDQMIQECIKQLKSTFISKLKKFPLEYDIYLTSIFSSFPQRPKFLRLVRELIDGNSISNDDLEAKVEGFGNIIESTLNAVIDLSSKVMEIEKKLTLQYPPQIPLEEEKSSKILMNKVISELNNVIINKEKELG